MVCETSFNSFEKVVEDEELASDVEGVPQVQPKLLHLDENMQLSVIICSMGAGSVLCCGPTCGSITTYPCMQMPTCFFSVHTLSHLHLSQFLSHRSKRHNYKTIFKEERSKRYSKECYSIGQYHINGLGSNHKTHFLHISEGLKPS